ncbi:MAG TPA: T9SS type A sorting domain-containing protein [bacterium]
MKIQYLLILLLAVSLAMASRGDTLMYDDGTFDDGLGFYTSTGVVNPDPESAYGFADHFILSSFGLVNQKIVGIMLYFNLINDPSYDFRLYVWNNESGTLYPMHQGPHLYRDMNAVMPAAEVWSYFDLSDSSIVLPDTFWIGICYNHFVQGSGSDWYLAFNTMLFDEHMYLNDMDDPGTGWVPASTWGYNFAYGVRVVTEDITGVNERSVLMPAGRDIFKAPAIIRDKANVEFTLAVETPVKLTVLDVSGKVRETLISERMHAGTHSRTFTLGLESGIYFYRLEAGGQYTRKFLVVK